MCGCQWSSVLCHTGRAAVTVHPLMVPERGAAAEGLPTCTTLIGLLPSVDDGVPNEVRAPADCLSSLNTFKWVSPTMNLLVPLKT